MQTYAGLPIYIVKTHPLEMIGMYKVLVADDEYPFVQSMIQYDWAAWNCVLVGTALNGAEALRKCRHLRPQILITDINMPVMDGMELIDEVRKIIPDIQIILFTVYKEFDYAHRALHAGVIDYILKDMHIREGIGEAVEKAKQAYTRSHRDIPAEQFSGPIVYLPSTGEDTFIAKQLEAHFTEPYGLLLSVRMEKSGKQTDVAPEKIRQLLCPEDQQIVFSEEETDVLFRKNQVQSAESFLFDLHKVIGDIQCTAACSSGIRDIRDYLIKRQANQDALDHAFYTGERGLIAVNPPWHTSAQLSEGRLHEWIRKGMECGTAEELEALVMGEILTEAMETRVSPDNIRKLFEKILYRMEMKYDVRMETTLRDDIRDAFSYDNLCSILLRNAREAVRQRNSHGKLVEDALECMEKRLEDPGLQLNGIADILGVSAGYLSKKLKDETGEGFQEVLIRLRMEKAVRLLRGTNQKVYEIALTCGYTNYRSFVKAFRNMYHVTPKRFS